MAEDEETLTLNLSATVVEGAKAKEDAPGKRKQNDSLESEKFSAKKHKKERENDTTGERSTSGGKGKDEAFISSIFSHNPDVPRLDLTNVTPLHEQVFTSRAFSEVGVHPYLVQNLEQNLGVKEMTQVQMRSIPFIAGGKDCLIKSQTGSGKTLAYAIPIMQKLGEIRPKISRKSGTYALVIVPTRELAMQSFEYFEKLCRSFAWIVPGILVGGEKLKSEKSRLRKGVNILVSTPGRLINHIEKTECLSLKEIAFLVFDEADRMLELGYERDVQKIITAINEQMQGEARQTLMLSATLTSGIEQLSEVAMKHPTFIDVTVSEENREDSLKSLATPENLKQTFLVVPAKLRLACLAAFILWKCRFSRSRKLLVFLATQDMVDYHCELLDRCLNLDHVRSKGGKSNRLSGRNPSAEAREMLSEVNVDETALPKSDERDGIPFLKLHGSMGQKDRVDVFNNFRKASSGVLLCTDVAARGLDLPQVDWILQYNPPTSKEDYVHRVGRTARIGQKGSSLIFLLPSEANFVKDLEGESLLLAEMTVEQILSKLHRHATPSPKTGRIPSTMEEAATDLQMRFENAVAYDEGLHGTACQAYVSYIRSYASYPKEVRDTFCFKKLHLGHVAKSYALRDPPKKITGLGKGSWVKSDERKRERKSALKGEERVIKAQRKRIGQKELVMSEYASGFDGIDLSAVAKDKTKKNKLKVKSSRRAAERRGQVK